MSKRMSPGDEQHATDGPGPTSAKRRDSNRTTDSSSHISSFLRSSGLPSSEGASDDISDFYFKNIEVDDADEDAVAATPNNVSPAKRRSIHDISDKPLSAREPEDQVEAETPLPITVQFHSRIYPAFGDLDESQVYYSRVPLCGTEAYHQSIQRIIYLLKDKFSIENDVVLKFTQMDLRFQDDSVHSGVKT